MVALWTIVTGAVAFGAGCFGRDCEGDTQVWGREPTEGRLLDRDTWESGPVNGDWLPFPRQRSWIFDLRALGDRTPDLPIAYVSAERNPLRDGTNFTVGAGNIVELSSADKRRITVHNGTCADYYVRVVVKTAPAEVEAGSDAGADAARDANAPTDASAE